MTIQSLLRPQSIFFALCLGAVPLACAVENDDDDDDGGDGASDVDVEVDDDGGDDDADADALEKCQAECEDDACLVDCENNYAIDCGDHC